MLSLKLLIISHMQASKHQLLSEVVMLEFIKFDKEKESVQPAECGFAVLFSDQKITITNSPRPLMMSPSLFIRISSLASISVTVQINSQRRVAKATTAGAIRLIKFDGRDRSAVMIYCISRLAEAPSCRIETASSRFSQSAR